MVFKKWIAPNPSVHVCIVHDVCECMGLNMPGDVGLVTQQQHCLATLLPGLCYYRLFSVLQSHTLSADVVGSRPGSPTNRGGGGGSFQGISIAFCRGEGVVFLTDSLQVSTGGFEESKGEARQDYRPYTIPGSWTRN